MTEEDDRQIDRNAPCGCFSAPHHSLVEHKELGMDENFAEVSLLVCANCGQFWLRYFYEVEAFTASGRWYRGAIPEEQVDHLTVENAKATLDGLSWYFYGGSYFGGRSGRASGRITLNP